MTSPRRRVLFLIPTLTGGGAERVIVTLLQHLERPRFQLALAVVDLRDAAFRDEVPADVEFIDLHCTRVLHALPKVLKLIWLIRPDVVMSTLGHLNVALAMLRPFLPRSTRFIARETTIPTHGIQDNRWPKLWGMAYRRFYGRFARVICQSEAMRVDMVEAFGVPASRVSVINNPVDLERIAQLASCEVPQDVPQFGQPYGGVDLISAGRLVEQKGVALTLRALALAADRRFRLTILGDGPDRHKLSTLAGSLGLGDRVRFVGFQANPYCFLARADALILSSRYEGFPNVALEALACGTPIVALPMPGGLPEIVQGVPGCQLASGMSAQELAMALQRFVPTRVPRNALDRFAVDYIASLYAKEFS